MGVAKAALEATVALPRARPRPAPRAREPGLRRAAGHARRARHPGLQRPRRPRGRSRRRCRWDVEDPAPVAETINFLLSDAARAITAEIIHVDGGFHAMGTQITPDPRGGRGVKPPVFLTGATGFLGMEVMARLLEKGDREVIALVRAADDAAAQERLRGRHGQALARPLALPRPGARRRRRRHVARPRAWTPATRSAVAEEAGAVHALRRLDLVRPAAGRGAHDQRRGHARDHRASPARPRTPARMDRFIHVSTAYVAGHHEGTFRERQLDAGQDVPQHLRADQVGGRARRQRRRPTSTP